MSLEGEPSVRSFLPLSYSFGDPSDDEERRGDDPGGLSGWLHLEQALGAGVRPQPGVNAPSGKEVPLELTFLQQFLKKNQTYGIKI